MFPTSKNYELERWYFDMTKFATIFCSYFILLSTLHASPPLIYSCSQKATVQDSILLNGLKHGLKKFEQAKFINIDSSNICRHKHFITKEFNNMLRGQYFSNLTSHNFSFINHNGEVFSVDKITFNNKEQYEKFSQALKNSKRRILMTKAPIAFDYLAHRKNLYLFVSDSGFKTLKPLIESIKVELHKQPN